MEIKDISGVFNEEHSHRFVIEKRTTLAGRGFPLGEELTNWYFYAGPINRYLYFEEKTGLLKKVLLGEVSLSSNILVLKLNDATEIEYEYLAESQEIILDTYREKYDLLILRVEVGIRYRIWEGRTK